MKREPTEMELRVMTAMDDCCLFTPSVGWRVLAQAAIRAMREPTPEITGQISAATIYAGKPGTVGDVIDMSKAGWRAAIDAASPPDA